MGLCGIDVSRQEFTCSSRGKRSPAEPTPGLLRHAEKRGGPGGEGDGVNVEVADGKLTCGSDPL